MLRFTTIGCALLLAATLPIRAVEEPDKEYVRIYRLIQEADLLRQSRQEKPALDKFNEAKSALEKLQAENPDWYAKVVQFRLNYINDRLKQMAAVSEGGKLPSLPQPQPASRSSETEQHLVTLVAEMTKLRAEKADLESRLRDAQLATATTAGRELAKAEEKLRGLQRENDTLKADIERGQTRLKGMVEASKLDEANKSLADANRRLEDQSRTNATLGSLQGVNEQLRRQLAEESKQKEAEAVRAAQAQKQAEQLAKDLAALDTQLKQAMSPTGRAELVKAEQQKIAELERQLLALPPLQSANEQLKRQLADAEQKRAVQEQSAARAQADLEVQKNLVKSLESKQAEEARKAAQAQKDLDSLKAQLAAGTPLQSANDQLKKQLADAEQKRAAQDQALAQARKDLEAQQALVKSLESGRTQQTEQMEQARKELAQLKADNASLEKQIREAMSNKVTEAERQQLAKNAESIRALQAENERLKKANETQSRQSASMVSRAELEAAQKALADANRRLAEQEKTLSSIESATQTLRLQSEELKKSDTARAQAQSRADSLSKELDKAKVDLAAQQSLAASQEAERQRQADKLRENLREIDRLQKDKRELEARLRETRPAVFPDASEFAKLEKRAAALKTENDSLRAEITQAQARAGKMVDPVQHETAQKALADANRKLAEQNKGLAQLGALQTANDNLRRQLAEMARRRDGRPATGAAGADLVAARQELAAQEKQIRQLQGEKSDLLAELERSSRQLADARGSISTGSRVRSADPKLIAKAEQQVRTLETENRRLKSERNSLADELLKSDRAMIEAKDASRVMGSRVQTLEQTASELRRRLEESLKQQPKPGKSADAAPALQDRLAALESKAVPFTPEELKLISQPAPIEAVKTARHARKTAKDFPVDQWPEISDAERAFNDGRFADAERKYRLALSRDEKSVFLLVNLAAAQLELNRLDEAEANLRRAFTVDTDDPEGLSVLGILRLKQNRFDDALEALSRASRLDPASAVTQNFLGVALSQKGQRGPAETALRRAIELQPGNAVAHNNLAVVYATQSPPYLELARWHYQKALAGGHRQNRDLEKILAANTESK